MLRHFEEKNDPSCLKSPLSDINWPPSSLLFKVVPPSFERGPVLLANLIRGGEGVTSAMDRPFKPKYGTVSQVFNVCNWLSYFYQWYPPFWLFSSQLQITHSSFLGALSLSHFSFRNFTTSSVDLLPSPSGLVRLVSQHSFSWFHPNAQPFGCVFSFLVTILQLASRIRGRRPFFYDFL